jgi:hypothetical protein
MKINNIVSQLFSIVFLWLISSSIYGEDLLENLSNSVDNIQKELNALPASDLEEAIIVDEAIKEIEKAMDSVEQSLSNNDADSAITTLEFIEKSLSDVSSIIPNEVYSDMSEMDMESFNQEDMEEIQIITQSMNSQKQESSTNLLVKMTKVNDLTGINLFNMAENLSAMGINTSLNVSLNIEKTEIMENWSKEQWAESWKGEEITTANGEKFSEDQLIDLKAELAISKASGIGIYASEEILSGISSTGLDTKSIISLEGSSLIAVVDTETLVDEQDNLKAYPSNSFTKGGQTFDTGWIKAADGSIIDTSDTSTGNLLIDVQSLKGSSGVNVVLTENFASNVEIQSVSEVSDTVSTLVAETASEVAQDVAEEVVKTVQEVAQQVAEEVQEVAETVSKITVDVEALSQMANDALGAWVMVDATTGKQIEGTGSIVCTLSVCGPSGFFGETAASQGAVYVLESLANPETGNVVGRCSGGDCQYNQ